MSTDTMTTKARHRAPEVDSSGDLRIVRWLPEALELVVARNSSLAPEPVLSEAPAVTAEQPPATPQPAPKATRATTGRQVLSGLWTGLTYGLFGLVLLLATVVILVPRFGGGIPLTVLSNSMEPNLPVGSLAVVLPIEPEDIRLGDVVTYLPNPDDPTAITHRVVGISHHDDGSRSFTFKGDNNADVDDPVRDYQVRAKVWYAVPLLGYVSLAFNGEHRSPVVLVLAGVFFLWAGRLWWRAWRSRRAAAKARTEQAAEPYAVGVPVAAVNR